MTRQEALAEAQRRWGPLGDVVEAHPRRRTGNAVHVGMTGPAGFQPLGSGDSWEAAFKDADARSS